MFTCSISSGVERCHKRGKEIEQITIHCMKDKKNKVMVERNGLNHR